MSAVCKREFAPVAVELQSYDVNIRYFALIQGVFVDTRACVITWAGDWECKRQFCHPLAHALQIRL